MLVVNGSIIKKIQYWWEHWNIQGNTYSQGLHPNIWYLDYEETFSPGERKEIIKLVLSLSAHKGYQVNHMDVQILFLNGYLYEEVYVQQPQGFEVKGSENIMYKLKKVMYGLKQDLYG